MFTIYSLVELKTKSVHLFSLRWLNNPTTMAIAFFWSSQKLMYPLFYNRKKMSDLLSWVSPKRFLSKRMQMNIWVRQQISKDHVVLQVFPKHWSGKSEWWSQPQWVCNVLLHPPGCCRCQGHTGDTRQTGAQVSQLQVVRSEIMTPLGDTVGFINCQAG